MFELALWILLDVNPTTVCCIAYSHPNECWESVSGFPLISSGLTALRWNSIIIHSHYSTIVSLFKVMLTYGGLPEVSKTRSMSLAFNT